MYSCLLRTTAASCPQLPVYVPSEAEKKDPALYASNVRDMMLRVGGFKASPASLQDSRAYIALLQARHREPNEHGCVASSAALRVPHPLLALCPPAVPHVSMQPSSLYRLSWLQRQLVCGSIKALCVMRLHVCYLQGKKPPKGSRAAMALEGASPEEIANGPAKKNK